MALPWYLLALGIFTLILGGILVALGHIQGSGQRFIDPSLRDEDIVRNLKRGPGVFSYLVLSLGVLIILVSIAWRIALRFL